MHSFGYVSRSAGSPVIKARILAARALTNIISYDEIESTMRLLCDLLVTSQSTNQQHGILLQAKHLLGTIYVCMYSQLFFPLTFHMRRVITNNQY